MYKPKQEKYKYTASLLDTIQKYNEACHDEAVLMIHKLMDEIIENFRYNFGFPRQQMEELHQIAEKNIQSIAKEGDMKDVSCKKGCSFCCMVPIAIAKEETLILKNKTYNRENYQAQADITTNEEFFKLPVNLRACMFLDKKKGECTVYHERPLMCRKYFVASPPKECDTIENPGGRVKMVAVNMAEVITSAVLNATEFGLMANMMSRYK